MGTGAPTNIPHRAGTYYPVLPTFAGTIFTPWSGEAVIYQDIAQHLYPPGDPTLASRIQGRNNDHSATAVPNITL